MHIVIGLYLHCKSFCRGRCSVIEICIADAQEVNNVASYTSITQQTEIITTVAANGAWRGRKQAVCIPVDSALSRCIRLLISATPNISAEIQGRPKVQTNGFMFHSVKFFL